MKQIIAKYLHKETSLPEEEIFSLIEMTPSQELGDFAFPCFSLAKSLKKNPVQIAQDLSSSLNQKEEFEKVEAKGPYVNFFINRDFLAKSVLRQILKQKNAYGSSKQGKNKKIVFDMSSPNIAKPFGIGHLRSTIIGNSLANICSFLGFKTIKINYLGDWGTPFGKIIAGYKKFGNPEKLESEPLKHLYEIYTSVSKDKNFEEQGRLWFKKLELGDKESLALWKKIRELSLKEFDKIYEKLGVKFDVISGESLYNKKMDKIVKELEQKGLLVESEGAYVVDLKKFNLGVCLIKKNDGTTLYATRDITAAIDRYKKYKFAKMIYEVGQEQKLHFQQLFKVLELMGYSWAKDCVHVYHGLYLGPDGKKFATRQGKTIFMENILEETQELAKKEIKSREKELNEKEIQERSKIISLAAIVYGDLKNHRANDAIFDVKKFLSFEGNTGPYLLYSYARAKSILRKANYSPSIKYTPSSLDNSEKQLILKLSNFQQEILNAHNSLAPNIIANYAYSLSQQFNEFYHSNQVIGSENESFRLVLVDSFSQVLKNSLYLLGIPVLEKM